MVLFFHFYLYFLIQNFPFEQQSEWEGSSSKLIPVISYSSVSNDAILQMFEFVSALSMQEAVLSNAGISSASAIVCIGELI